MAMPPTPAVAADASLHRPKVIYVMGTGRSGSTILGVTLGNCEDVFFAGELDKWLTRSGVPRREDPQLRGFWQKVRSELSDQIELLIAEQLELLGGRAARLERSSSLLNPRTWASRRRMRARYRRISEALYLTIARVTGATHIVDTSHYPLRAKELQSIAGIDLYLLYLVRDAQTVVASLGRADVVERRFEMPAANAYLWLTNLLSVIVFLRHPRERRVFVRHEDFLADPEGVLRELLELFDCPAPLPELHSLRTGVAFHGNRLLSAEVVALDRPPAAPVARSRATALLALPWAAVFSRLRPVARPQPSRARDRDAEAVGS